MNEVLLSNLLQTLALIFASIQFTRTALRSTSPEYTKGWVRLAFGAWVWVPGQIMQAYAEMLLHQSAFGTINDAFWLLGAFAIVGGLFALVVHSSGPRQILRPVYLLSSLVILCAILMMRSEGNFWNRVLKSAYRASDLIAIGLICWLVILATIQRNKRMMVQWVLFLAGAVMGSVGDLVWTSSSSRVADVLFMADYVLYGLSATVALRALVKSRNS